MPSSSNNFDGDDDDEEDKYHKKRRKKNKIPSPSATLLLLPPSNMYKMGRPSFWRRKVMGKIGRCLLLLLIVLAVSLNFVFVFSGFVVGTMSNSNRDIVVAGTANGHAASAGGGGEQQQQQAPTNRRSNQLKLQENTPKFLTLEVVSSRKRVAVSVDGNTVRERKRKEERGGDSCKV